jgi:hypothetical protein
LVSLCGSATDDHTKRLKSLREQYIALSKEVEDVMGSCWQTNKSLTRKSDQQSTSAAADKAGAV